MDRARIIGRVKLKLEEVSDQEQNMVVEDPMVDELLDDSVNELLLMAPRYLLHAQSFIPEISWGEDHVYNEDGTGYVVLPSDFLRLYSFKLTEWLRPVTTAISEDHPDYVLQKNIYTRGKKAKPVCVIRWDTTAESYILEYYSFEPADPLMAPEIEYANYIPETIAEDLQENLIDPLTWLVCAKVLQIYSDDPVAEQKALGKVKDWIILYTR